MAEYTTEALTEWLRGQPPDGEYVWSDPVFCLMGKYLADNGACWGGRSYSDLPHYEEIAHEKPWTYGAALERAERVKEMLALPAPSSQDVLQLEDRRETVTVA